MLAILEAPSVGNQLFWNFKLKVRWYWYQARSSDTEGPRSKQSAHFTSRVRQNWQLISMRMVQINDMGRCRLGLGKQTLD